MAQNGVLGYIGGAVPYLGELHIIWGWVRAVEWILLGRRHNFSISWYGKQIGCDNRSETIMVRVSTREYTIDDGDAS